MFKIPSILKTGLRLRTGEDPERVRLRATTWGKKATTHIVTYRLPLLHTIGLSSADHRKPQSP